MVVADIIVTSIIIIVHNIITAAACIKTGIQIVQTGILAYAAVMIIK